MSPVSHGRSVSAAEWRHGFTLIEVLAVVALISVVMFVALNFYTDLARATTRASRHTHDIRRAAAIVDRVARDFESAILIVKPPEMDPISHPWLFVGESQMEGPGADHVKFVTRNHDPTRSENRESDIAVVAYFVEKDEDGLLSLYRWSSPQLSQDLDRSFPYPDDEGSYLMAEGLESFGIEFIGPEGEPTDSWDSTLLEHSSMLPLAVDIQLALADPDLAADEDPLVYRRLELIRVRPLDLEPESNATDPTVTDPTVTDPQGIDGEGTETTDQSNIPPECIDPSTGALIPKSQNPACP